MKTTVSTLLHHLLQRQPALTYGALAFGLLTAIGCLLMLLDQQTVLGINRWIKPTKFAASISIFLFTMAWVLDVMKAELNPTQLHWLGTVMLLVMVIEEVLIITQAIRGVPSHFNTSSGINAAIYSTMGTAIFINTLVLGYVWWQSTQLAFSGLHPAYATAIRWGLFLLVLGSLQGMYMSVGGRSIVGGTHEASAATALPFLNWSTQFGDLRIAHFIALHGIQVLLVLCYLLLALDLEWLWLIRLVAVGILVLTAVAQVQAMAGRSL